MVPPEVFTLVLECHGRGGLPPGATGARLLCYAPGGDATGATRAALALAGEAGLAPCEVTVHGTLAERLAAGDVGEDERVLLERAGLENAVVIAEVAPLFGAADTR
jgi:hypothetical protein